MAVPRDFVSHSHHDNAFCREFVATLQAGGWDVWDDEKGMGGGAHWVAIIPRELEAREEFLLILTPDAWDSHWVQEEISLALATNRQIIPVLHKPTQVAGFIRTRQWIDVIGLPGAAAAQKVAQEMGRPLEMAGSASSATGRPPSSPPPAPQPPARPTWLPARLAALGFAPRTLSGIEVIIPPVVPVPAGEFHMSSDKRKDPGASDDELKQRPVTLGAYQIGQYPVTVAEYACAVRAQAVGEPQKFLGIDWATQLKRLDHPVVCVTWGDAVAYAAWLAKAIGQPWRLPTEAEWEKAARGGDGRIYPWGNQFDKTRCNTREGGKGGTTPVGAYADRGDASPYGAHDQAGNVWEWTSSLYKPYPYIFSDGREDQYSTGNRVLRGGSWFNLARDARAAFRVDYRPAALGVGFRLALAPAGS